jgi:hypothetical protein
MDAQPCFSSRAYHSPTTDCDGNGMMVMICSNDDAMTAIMVTTTVASRSAPTVTATPCRAITPTVANAVRDIKHYKF